MAMPDAGWASGTESELADLEQIWETLDIPGHRVELIDGQIVVSPSASRSHSVAINRLIDALIDIKRKHGWGDSHEPDRAHRADQGAAHS
jgi:hypothetical protein